MPLYHFIHYASCDARLLENTYKNRNLLDEMRDVMDWDEYLSIEVGLFT